MQFFNKDDLKSEATLKVAYRRLSKHHHPDVGGTKERFQDLQNEHELLKKQLNTFAKLYDFDKIFNAAFNVPAESDVVETNVDYTGNGYLVNQTYNDYDLEVVITLPKDVYDKGYMLHMKCNQFGLEKKFSVKPKVSLTERCIVDISDRRHWLHFKVI